MYKFISVRTYHLPSPAKRDFVRRVGDYLFGDPTIHYGVNRKTGKSDIDPATSLQDIRVHHPKDAPTPGFLSNRLAKDPTNAAGRTYGTELGAFLKQRGAEQYQADQAAKQAGRTPTSLPTKLGDGHSVYLSTNAEQKEFLDRVKLNPETGYSTVAHLRQPMAFVRNRFFGESPFSALPKDHQMMTLFYKQATKVPSEADVVNSMEAALLYVDPKQSMDLSALAHTFSMGVMLRQAFGIPNPDPRLALVLADAFLGVYQKITDLWMRPSAIDSEFEMAGELLDTLLFDTMQAQLTSDLVLSDSEKPVCYAKLPFALQMVCKMMDEQAQGKYGALGTAKYEAKLHALRDNPDQLHALLKSEAYVRQVTAILHVGSDALATALSWTLYRLAHQSSSEWTAQIRRELESGDSPLLRQVIQEVLRLDPPSPLVPIIPQESITLASGKVIPKGSFVVLNSLWMGQDPDVFVDPTAFKPERWADESLPKTTAFGGGNVTCPAVGHAPKTLYRVIEALFRRSTVTTVPGSPHPDTCPRNFIGTLYACMQSVMVGPVS
ncbi:MAG: cytochrome P450 [Candidatus Margulisiibacteriota bacterium]